jgi:hypothetical protein
MKFSVPSITPRHNSAPSAHDLAEHFLKNKPYSSQVSDGLQQSLPQIVFGAAHDSSVGSQA